MRKFVIACGIALPVCAFAGGFERDDQSPSYLFNDGRYVEFKLSMLNSDIKGTVPLGPTTQSSGSVGRSYTNLSFAYKADINEKLSYAFAYAEPYGADINYGNASAAYPFRGSTAKLNGRGITALLKYKLNDQFSVYGGARANELDADARVIITVPNPNNPAQFLTALNYSGESDRDIDTGYVLGAAYEIKDIALRFALTYSSEIDHSVTASETATGINVATGQPFSIPATSSTVETTIPSSINLAFQSGITPKTLLFGSVHWAEWTKSEITPPVYFQVTNGTSLVDHSDDVTTVKLGLARRINDKLALAIVLGHEESTGEVSPNLSPTDGYDSVTVAARITEGKSDVTIGVSYFEVGDTTTNAQVGTSDFSSNSAIGVGVKFGYSF